MGNHSDGSPNHSGTVATAGQNEVEKFQDPGIPPHRLRLADTDPKAAKRAERQVAVLFGASVVGTLIFLVAYFAIDLGEGTSIATIRLQNALLGVGTAFAMLGIGTGIVHWAKALMPDHEVSEERHPIRTEEDRLAAVRIVDDIVEETGIKLEGVELSDLGEAKRLTITKENTTIVEGPHPQHPARRYGPGTASRNCGFR